MNTNKKFPDYRIVTADWKDLPGLIDDFESAMKYFGLHIVNDPLLEDSDTYSFIISKEKITRKVAKQISNKEWGLD